MKFNIITPFSRPENKQIFIDHLREFRKDVELNFYPTIEIKPETNDWNFPNEDWIRPFRYELPQGFKRGDFGLRVCMYALNNFIDFGDIRDKEYYITMSDDDFIEPDFFKKLQGIDSDFIVTSMKRGDRVTEKGHGVSTLMGQPENMRTFHISGEQVISKGRIFKLNHFEYLPHGDGVMIEKWWREYPYESFTFVPDAYFWFNYLEPGRYNKK